MGYGAVLEDDQGVHSPLRVEAHGSMVRVFSDGTTLQSVSNYVSLFFYLLLLGIGTYTLLSMSSTILLLTYPSRKQVN